MRIFDQIKDLIREIRKGVADPEFWEIVEETTGQKPKKLSHRPSYFNTLMRHSISLKHCGSGLKVFT